MGPCWKDTNEWEAKEQILDIGTASTYASATGAVSLEVMNRFLGKGFRFVGRVSFAASPGDDVEKMGRSAELREGMRIPIRQVLITSEGYQYMSKIDSSKREKTATAPRMPASTAGGLRRRRRMAVIGSDTRSILTDTTTNPLFYIGQMIYPNFGGKCTGTIVAPRSIVTAGHCLFKKGEWSFPSTFSPGRYNQGESIKTRTDPYGVWVADHYVVTQTWLDSESWDSDLGIVTFTNNFFQHGEAPAINVPTELHPRAGGCKSRK